MQPTIQKSMILIIKKHTLVNIQEHSLERIVLTMQDNIVEHIAHSGQDSLKAHTHQTIQDSILDHTTQDIQEHIVDSIQQDIQRHTVVSIQQTTLKVILEAIVESQEQHNMAKTIPNNIVEHIIHNGQEVILVHILK